MMNLMECIDAQSALLNRSRKQTVLQEGRREPAQQIPEGVCLAGFLCHPASVCRNDGHSHTMFGTFKKTSSTSEACRMQNPREGWKVVLARDIDGRTELVEWIRAADTVWIVRDGQERTIGPEEWRQEWADLESHGFVEVFPTDQRKMATEKLRVLDLVRSAFQGVSLGEGVGLLQGQGLDDYADECTLASYRAKDEKHDWSAIPVADLDRCYSSLSFFDADGMRFHLPAYLVAELEGNLQTADVVFHLVYSGHGGNSRFETLSAEQREAVRAFLLLLLSDAHREFEHPMIQAALRDYWTKETMS